jgi:hypothetical protein
VTHIYSLVFSSVFLFSVFNVVLNHALAAYTGQCSTPQDIIELPPQHWCEVPNSHARDRAEKKPNEWDDWNGTSSSKYNSYQAATGFLAIVQNWSGAAFDSSRNRLVIFGGGHNGYFGNELIAFDLDDMAWIRITDPTPFPSFSGRSNDDGTPRGRHSYNGLTYISHADTFFALGGSPAQVSGSCGMQGTALFDFTANTWNTPVVQKPNEPDVECEDHAVYDPVSKNVLYHGRGVGDRWSLYNIDSDTWTTSTSVGFNQFQTAAIDPVRRLVLVTGDEFGEVLNAYDLTNLPNMTPTDRTSLVTGPRTLMSAIAPGWDFDNKTNEFVGWDGGTTVFSFNPDTNVWTQQNAAAGNLLNPGAVDAVKGTYGRWRYSEKYNVFVLVDSVDENVYLYRLSPDTGTRPSPPTNLQVQ